MRSISALLLISFLIFTSACKSPSVGSSTIPVKYGTIDVFSISKKKAKTTVLFIPDDDTISVQKQVEFLLPLLDKQTELYAFPKYNYQNVSEKNNADQPNFRLELLVEAYQNLTDKGLISEDKDIYVLGLGEGTLIAPHFARITNADRLFLINPLYHSYKQNFSMAYTEKTKNARALKSYMGLASEDEWLSFFYDIENKRSPDKSAGQRNYRYYFSYWEYEPGKFIGSELPTQILIFKQYYLSSENDKTFMKSIKKPNITTTFLEGFMFSKFSASEIKKLDWF